MEHEAGLEIHRAARAAFRRILAGAKLPGMDALKQERQRLTAAKMTAYQKYRAAKNDMQELILVKKKSYL